MSDKKWTVVLATLFLAFMYLLIQFIASAYRNQELIHQLSKSEVDHGTQTHIMLISQELNNPYWRMVGQGAADAAAETGIVLQYIAPLRIDVEEQAILLEKAIASKVDAILIQGVHGLSYSQLIDKAVDQGIPVITVDADSPDSKRITYVGTDNLESGRVLGELVTKYKSSDAKIGVIMGSNLAVNQMLRLEGFRSVISAHKGLEIVDIRNSNISRIEAAQRAIEMLDMHPELDTMVGLSALDAVGILQGLKNIGRSDIAIFSFDGLEETKEAIARGEIIATVAQKPYVMGYYALSLAQQVIQGKQIPHNHFIEVEVIQTHRTDRSDGK